MTGTLVRHRFKQGNPSHPSAFILIEKCQFNESIRQGISGKYVNGASLARYQIAICTDESIPLVLADTGTFQ